MKPLTLLSLLTTPLLATCHATVQAVWINDIDQGLGNSASGYIRSPPNNSPLTDVTSSSLTCNVNNSPTAKTLAVKSGDKVTFEWHHESRSSSDQIIDPSHNGPVLVYIAPTSTGSTGRGWVKLSEDGLSGGKWAVERLRAAGGKHSVTIPDLAAGEYLLRPEIIALHEGYRSGGAQFYMECVQIKVTSSGSKTLPSGVSIPGAYSATDPGILVDIYSGISSYKIPGPAVWDGSSGGGTNPQQPTSSVRPGTTSSVRATTLSTMTRTTSASVQATTSAGGVNSAGAGAWAQCGGIGWTGATSCQSGLTCKQQNSYYYQCIPN